MRLGSKIKAKFRTMLTPSRKIRGALGEISVSFTILAHMTKYLLYFYWCAVLPTDGFRSQVLKKVQQHFTKAFLRAA